MQQTDLRSQFDVARTAPNSLSGIRVEPNAFLQTVLLALILLTLCSRISTAAESEDGLLDFTATWCGPCQQMSSIVSRLERQGAPIRKVDIDQEPGLAKKYGIQSIPCFVLVSNGQEIDRVTGLTTENQLRSMLNRLPKSAPLAKSGAAAVRDDSTATAGLGVPVPLTPQKTSERGKNAFLNPPQSLGNMARERNLAEAPDFQSTVRGQSPDETSDPLQASVRIRVKDGNAVNFGSGTVIDSRPGQSIILTCGHIFRKLTKDAVIEVDLYPASKLAKPDTVIGRVLHADLNADVGIMTVSSAQRLPCIKLAVQDKSLTKQERLISIGCSGGDKPTREDHQLTAINKYDGPENLECTGLPQQGRSGGGLFRGSELVGVCIAADPKQNRGIYTGLKPINAILDKVGLASLCPQLPTAPADTGLGQFASLGNAPGSGAGDSGSLVPGHATGIEDDVNRLLDRELNAASGEANPDLAGAEVVCIVRSRTPGVPSRVIIVNQASERFVADLLHESRGDAGVRQANHSRAVPAKAGSQQSGPVETSYEPKPYRRPAAK